ncbi:hypothetical protein METBIDRAFT_29426 [Metschnikowia bicuspidata var. bicuspidata NRRL YB-4993]|uniref:Uncharacterized protein n=1 Tax=Metschnikowia bicuspidata var. bicuspidata NRRL YB-4993 TaxID=869754 RepID=A0A1A0HFR8_9ASCO|nr:hypothetical protein METBIDRAFT_29426 [Metschnikowia bicuspidata var. bicuspidata NRRL YB-4993]OBA22846.1 hypothetical protein METBIDRAFT_29426 [Metschnikowia bicuspidata var. bicuspidata NRRL YB-4993]
MPYPWKSSGASKQKKSPLVLEQVWFFLCLSGALTYRLSNYFPGKETEKDWCGPQILAIEKCLVLRDLAFLLRALLIERERSRNIFSVPHDNSVRTRRLALINHVTNETLKFAPLTRNK